MNQSTNSYENNSLDYLTVDSLPKIWSIAAQEFGDTIALCAPHAKPEVTVTYRDLAKQIQQFAAGLQALGVKPQSKVSLFADNSPRWFIADQGIMTAGAVNVVRSSAAEPQELLYILEHSDSTSLVVENSDTFHKLSSHLNNLPIELVVILYDGEIAEGDLPVRIVNYQQLMTIGTKQQLQLVPQNKETLATLIYTSGTTGKPKGAMLSHGNLLHQIINLEAVIQPKVGDRALSILPSWHAYERSGEYFLLSHGCTLYYTNLRSIKKDLQQYKPHYMVGVPRLWESIYEGVQRQFREQPNWRQKLINFFFGVSEQYVVAKRIAHNLSLEHFHVSKSYRFLAQIKASLLFPLHALADKIVYRKVRDAVGGNIKTIISGGGSLAKHLDDFYEIVNIPLLVGYGLTETSPVTNARSPNHNIRGTAGRPIPQTEIKIVDPDSRQTLPLGQRGLVLIRGPQVMQGYYKNPEATAKAIDTEGWFDSGDLGWITPTNDLVLTGRVKDTIVLSNGENIEPQPIEDACVRSPYIDQIMLVGQDQRSLGALIVPNLEALQQWTTNQQLNLNLPSPHASPEEVEASDLHSKEIYQLIRQELNREVKNRPGYRADDRIGPFRLIGQPFSIENGMMTQTLKIKRPVIYERYQYLIDSMFRD
ncbi:long-chain fatty acid--CoA ligase [Pleurocapsales cyanobacterium LEGE 06147]|nr:long-chain fatty acid--CoA ligase [Pleurocapsales cyanobacterium LEGE 06147]